MGQMGEEEPDSGRIPVIKIKLPKKAAAAEEEAPSHYCKECDRSFSSGKALGGHMSSAHVQANKDYSMRKAMSSSSKTKSSPGSPSAACRICGRVFQSQKSLFGHMRCHPERDWRGMEPPPRDAKADSEDAPQELGFFNFKTWPTSKRGRPSVSSSKEAAMEEEDEEERRKGKGKGEESGVIDEMDEIDEKFNVAVQVLASGKRERGEGNYRCNDCGRVFESHEALGGHRASHNKFKMTVVNTSTRHLEPTKMKMKKKMTKKIKVDFDKTNADAGPSANNANANANANGDGDGDGERGSASASTTTPTSASASTTSPTSASACVFAIDLNMLPPDEEEEEEEEEGEDMEESSNHTS